MVYSLPAFQQLIYVSNYAMYCDDNDGIMINPHYLTEPRYRSVAWVVPYSSGYAVAAAAVVVSDEDDRANDVTTNYVDL